MGVFTGTGRLVRLALRRDRVTLPIWIAAIAGLMTTSVPAVTDIYAGSLADRVTYALSGASSIVARVFNGLIDGPSIGSILVAETFMFSAILAAFMSTLTVIRHTRQNEETGRTELISAGVVGRYAGLTAALIVAVGANLVLAVLIALALLGGDMLVAGSWALSLGIACVGITFAAIAGVTAQLSESARGANSLAAIAIGIAFLLRALGDGIGTITNHGLSVQSAWLSWLSPIGWAQQVFPYTRNNWWIYGLYAAAFVAIVAVAFMLASKRDVGLGILPARRGPAAAAAGLLSSIGLAWRLQRGTLYGWLVAIAILGATIGIMAKEFQEMFTDNTQAAEVLRQLAGSGNITDVLLGAMISFTALGVAGYAVQALQRLRAEESSGRLEPVLATGVGRQRWVMSHIGCVGAGIVALLFVLGISTGTAYVLVTDAVWSEVVRLTAAAFAYIPAIIAIVGIVVAAFGLVPQLAVALAWSVFGVCILMGQLGAILELPQLVLDLSPFTHIPAAPAKAVTAPPLLWLSTIGIGLTALGIAGFKRRDITTS